MSRHMKIMKLRVPCAIHDGVVLCLEGKCGVLLGRGAEERLTSLWSYGYKECRTALKHIHKKWELVWCEFKKASCSRLARSRAPVGCSVLEYLLEKSTILPPYTFNSTRGEKLTTRTLAGWHALADILKTWYIRWGMSMSINFIKKL